MNKLTLIALALLIACSAGQTNSVFAAEATKVTQEIDWKVFSKNLEKALLFRSTKVCSNLPCIL